MNGTCEVFREFGKIPQFIERLWRRQNTEEEVHDGDRSLVGGAALQVHGEPFGVNSEGWSEIIENEWQFDCSIVDLGLTPRPLPNAGLPGDQPPPETSLPVLRNRHARQQQSRSQIASNTTCSLPHMPTNTVATASLDHHQANTSTPLLDDAQESPKNDSETVEVGSLQVLTSESKYPGIFDESRGQSPERQTSYTLLSPVRDEPSLELRKVESLPFKTLWMASSAADRRRRETHRRKHLQRQALIGHDDTSDVHQHKRVTFASDSVIALAAAAATGAYEHNANASSSSPEMTTPPSPNHLSKRRKLAHVLFHDDVLEHVIPTPECASDTWYDRLDYFRFQYDHQPKQEDDRLRLDDVSSDDAVTVNGIELKLF